MRPDAPKNAVRGRFAMAVVIAAAAALAIAPGPSQGANRSYEIKQKTIGVMAGEPEWLPLVQDVANSLNHRKGLRILPIAGEGAIQSVSDLIHIDGIDIALIPADSIAYAKAQGLLPVSGDKIAYVSRMGSIKVLLVTRKETTSLTELAGKRIATGPAQSAGFATGEFVLGALGLPFSRVPEDGTSALQSLQAGKADAAFVLGTQNLAVLKNPDLYRVLPLPLPQELHDTYAPALLTRQELARHGVVGETIDTISTALVLAVFNWSNKSPHSDALYAFGTALLEASSLPDSDAPWARNNLAADVPGLLRHSSAIRAFGANKQSDATP